MISTVAVRRLKTPGPSGPWEAPGAAGGKNVVRAGGVVAEGGRAALTDEDAAGGRDRAREQLGVLGEDLEVLGGDGVGEQYRGLGIRDRDQGQRCVLAAIPRSAASTVTAF